MVAEDAAILLGQQLCRRGWPYWLHGVGIALKGHNGITEDEYKIVVFTSTPREPKAAHVFSDGWLGFDVEVKMADNSIAGMMVKYDES